MTVDWPEKNTDGRMPVLDLKVWVDRSQDIPRISYSFYKKEVASKFTILKRSAVSEGVKKQTLFQEGIRRLSHVAMWLPWVEVVAHMNEWSNCMRISGYSQKERYEAIRGAVMRQEEMKRKLEQGEIQSLHRGRREIQASKERKGGLQASTWYLRGQTARTVRCDPTPGSRLCKSLNEALNPVGTTERTLVVEEGGVPVTSQVRRGDPFFNGSCRYGDPSCMARQGVDCGLSGVLYEATCNSCLEPVDLGTHQELESREPGKQPRYNYIGMTMTSLHNRMEGHKRGQKYKQSGNPLWRHDKEKHNCEPQGYSFKILSREQKILPLNVLEGLYIEAQIQGTSLNDRNERGRGGLVRISANRN